MSFSIWQKRAGVRSRWREGFLWTPPRQLRSQTGGDWFFPGWKADV